MSGIHFHDLSSGHTKEPTVFKTLFEAPEAEVARLAEAPVGSISHSLSLLPVNIRGSLQDLMIEVPLFGDCTVVVVPFERYENSGPARVAPYKRHAGNWRCLVVASDHPSYPVGGYRLSISESQLVRGVIRTLAPAEAPVLADA